MVRPVREPEWMQVNVALFPGHRPGEPYIPWDSLAEAIERWREAERFELFHLTRKPPGLRLRFFGRALPTLLEPEMLPWLSDAERRNDIRSFRPGRYEPEEHRFGGELGMALAHRLFDADTAGVLEYERTQSREQVVEDRFDVAFAMAHDLLGRVLADDAEIWDVWKRLAAAVDTGEPPDGSSLDAPPQIHSNMVEQSAALEPLLQRAAAANDAVAGALRAAALSGALTVGLRAWLTAATTFQWNRWGLPLDMVRLAEAVGAVVSRLQPDQTPWE